MKLKKEFSSIGQTGRQPANAIVRTLLALAWICVVCRVCFEKLKMTLREI